MSIRDRSMGPYGLYGPMAHMGSYGLSWVAQALMSHHGPSSLREFVLVTLPSSFPCARLGARYGTLDLPLITTKYDHIFRWKQHRFTNLLLQKKKKIFGTGWGQPTTT